MAPPFLTSAVDRGEWLDSRPCRFTPKDKANTVPIGHCGAQSRFGRYGKDKNVLVLGIEPGLSSP
jgi:hypothetical protein